MEALGKVSDFMQRRQARVEQQQKTIAIYTIRYNNHPYASREGIFTLDARSNVGMSFAIPSPNLKRAMVDGEKDEEWFLQMYAQQLEETKDFHKLKWMDLLNSKKLAIGCEHTHTNILAHRYILRAFLINFAIEKGYNVMHGGEIHVNPRTNVAIYRKE